MDWSVTYPLARRVEYVVCRDQHTCKVLTNYSHVKEVTLFQAATECAYLLLLELLYVHLPNN